MYCYGSSRHTASYGPGEDTIIADCCLGLETVARKPKELRVHWSCLGILASERVEADEESEKI